MDSERMDPAILKAVGFVHLHVHSAYSLREGALTIETLAKLAQADAMPALAITDTNNLFGALEFSEKLAKAACSRSSARADASLREGR
jgi:DNA polymerase III subunit alpha